MAFQGWLGRALTRLGLRPSLDAHLADVFRESANPAQGVRAYRGEPRILIAEDHPVNRLVLQSMLGMLGFRADEAADGNEAMEACRTRAYDLILMDCHMPNLDGIECARRIRTLDGPRPVIVGITAEALEETRNNCLEAGMDQVISKPVEKSELREILMPWKAPEEKSEPGDGRVEGHSQWVDLARLVRLVESTRMRDREYRKRAFAQFRADLLSLRFSLREAGASGKAGDLNEAAHGLKGLCLTMGLNRLAETCQRIEAASMLETSPDWSPVLGDFEAAFEPSLAALGQALDMNIH